MIASVYRRMLIQKAIRSICLMPDSWVRVDHVSRTRGGLDLRLSVHEGRRGKAVDSWIITCRGVHEIYITDLDGGGLALYPTSHPAAQQYVARQAELRWPRSSNEANVIAKLHRVHAKAVDDWIPFDRYLLFNVYWITPSFAPVSGDNFVCRGPEFLLRAYAKALRTVGEQARLTLRGSSKAKPIRPSVLHFGTSYVVANVFAAEHLARVRP
jgi:hypothetical protein